MKYLKYLKYLNYFFDIMIKHLIGKVKQDYKIIRLTYGLLVSINFGIFHCDICKEDVYWAMSNEKNRIQL